jgi:hypothetical protein
MQITPELLRLYAQTTVDKCTREDYSILAVYLTGSLLTQQDPFLGGTTDIDLVFIHIGDPKTPREIVPINENVHYDILHHPQRKYLDRISLRTDPQMGPMLSEAVALHDPQHFIDLTQASVRGLFHHTENIIQRAQTQSQAARDSWLDFQAPPLAPGPAEILRYFEILDQAANVIALLTEDMLTERRFLINLRQCADKIGRPGLTMGFLGMLGAPRAEREQLVTWVDEWENTFKSLPKEGCPASLHPARLNYYRKGFDTILKSDQPLNVLWPLLHTWTLAAESLPASDPGFQSWKDTLNHLGLLGAGFAERILALDALLDQVEESIKTWEMKENV